MLDASNRTGRAMLTSKTCGCREERSTRETVEEARANRDPDEHSRTNPCGGHCACTLHREAYDLGLVKADSRRMPNCPFSVLLDGALAD